VRIDLPLDASVGSERRGRCWQLLVRFESRESELLFLEVKVNALDGFNPDGRGDADGSGVPAAKEGQVEVSQSYDGCGHETLPAKVTGEINFDALEQDRDVDLSEPHSVLEREETSDLGRVGEDLLEREADDTEDGIVFTEARVFDSDVSM
jgi:hypothetical protein